MPHLHDMIEQDFGNIYLIEQGLRELREGKEVSRGKFTKAFRGLKFNAKRYKYHLYLRFVSWYYDHLIECIKFIRSYYLNKGNKKEANGYLLKATVQAKAAFKYLQELDREVG